MGAERFARPRVVLSRCLELAACRYDGDRIPSDVVRRLAPHVELVGVCPEVEIGLGVPRAPIRLVEAGGAAGGGAAGGGRSPRLVQPSTGRDLTARMTDFGHRFTDATADVDGVLLKSRSPSCGVTDAKRFPGADAEEATGAGPGLFAAIVMARYPEAAVADEARLTDPDEWHAWLTRIFASAAAREGLDAAAAVGAVGAGGGPPYPRALQ